MHRTSILCCLALSLFVFMNGCSGDEASESESAATRGSKSVESAPVESAPDVNACTSAGGKCVLGSFRCANPGPKNAHGVDTSCNTDPPNPGGGYCCLPCPSGTAASEAGTACE